MVRLMEGPLGVLVQVRPLQTKGCDAYVDREECSAATSQQVEEVRKAKSVRVMNTSLIYIYILRMQSSVQAQGVELGKEVPMQVSKGTQLRLMEGPRRVLVLRPLQTFGNIIDGCHIEEAGQAEGGEGLLLSRYLHLIVGRYEKVVDTISPYSATSIVQAQSMIKCCRPIPFFFARVVVKDKGGRHTMPKVLRQKVIKLDLGEAWYTLGTVSAEFLCLPHLHGGPEEIGSFGTFFYSSQVSKPKPDNQNDCTTLTSAQGRSTLSTVRGYTPSLTPRWSSSTRRAPRYPNQYEHKGYTVGVVTRVRILFESLCNCKQIEIR